MPTLRNLAEKVFVSGRSNAPHQDRNKGSRSSSSSNMGCSNGKPVLTDVDLDFIALHTAVSRQEVERQYENFLSKHPDGKISKSNFRSMMNTCYPEKDTAKLEKHIFRMYDANGDGCIDFREFMIVLYVLSSGSPEENLKQIFRIFDINNDGAISKKEMLRIVKDLFHLLSDEENPDNSSEKALATKAFEEMDTNSDGSVSREEFIKACMSHERISTILTLKIINVFIGD